MIIKVCLLLLIFFISKALSQTQCNNVGFLTVYFEPLCSSTISLGCNAGGQGQNCRFCGFDVYPPCPSTIVTTIGTTTTVYTGPSGTTPSTNNPGSTISTNTGGPLLNWNKAPDPIRRKYIDHPVKKPSILLDHTGPLPTNSWYQNLLLGTGELVINVLPIQIKAKQNGLEFGQIASMANLVVDDKYVLQPYLADWTYKTNSAFTSKRVTNLKDLSVSVIYTFLTGTMEIPLITGMGFVTAIYRGLIPELVTIRAILNVKVDDAITYRPGDTTVSGNKFVINLNSGTYWVVFSTEKISFKINGNDLTGTNTINTVLKTSLVGTTDTSSQWNAYSAGYVASADVYYQINGDSAEIQYVWNVVGSNNALMYTLPHHLNYLVGSVRTGIKAYGIKGEMEAIGGNFWLMKIPLTTISWNAVNSIDPSKRQAVLNALIEDQNLDPTAPDPYFFGLELARSGRLALIADELGETAIATNIRNRLKTKIIPWLEGTNQDPLRYDRIHGGLVTQDGIDDAGADFGNGYYNDHHFHYGYHIYSIAVIGKTDPAFLNTYADEINVYIRDYANPSRIDSYFTHTRQKDWFSWHSWAAGLYEFGDNRNQESTSEAVNAYYAISLLGKSLNNKELDDFGRLMTTMEIISTKAYWQMPSYSNIYPEKFKKNLLVGVLWNTKVDYTTFFGGNTEFIHGIQFLPFTPITEEYLDKRFMAEEKSFLDANVIGATEDWEGYMIEAKAIVDKENQWTKAQTLQWYHAGSSRTNCFYWIATR